MISVKYCCSDCKIINEIIIYCVKHNESTLCKFCLCDAYNVDDIDNNDNGSLCYCPKHNINNELLLIKVFNLDYNDNLVVYEKIMCDINFREFKKYAEFWYYERFNKDGSMHSTDKIIYNTQT